MRYIVQKIFGWRYIKNMPPIFLLFVLIIEIADIVNVKLNKIVDNSVDKFIEKCIDTIKKDCIFAKSL